MSSYYKRGEESQLQTTDTGTQLPRGGVTGQVLRKKSNSDYDVEWVTEEPRQLVENNYSTTTFESASLTGISEELAIVYAIALG